MTRSALAALIVGATLVAFPVEAADPPSGSISAASPTFEWSGTVLAPSLNNCIATNVNCDDFFLSVEHSGSWQAEVRIEPVNSAEPLLDIDLFVYDAAGNLVGESTSSTPYEAVKFVGPPGGGLYRIQVSVWRGTSILTGYQGHAEFLRSLECLDPPTTEAERAASPPLDDLTSERSAALQDLREKVVAAGSADFQTAELAEALAKAIMERNGFTAINSEASSTGSTSVVVATIDMDGDGRSEVIAIDAKPGNTAIELRDGPTGSLLWSRPVKDSGFYRIADLQGDSRQEMLLVEITPGETWAQSRFDYSVIDSLDAHTIWQRTSQSNGSFDNFAGIAVTPRRQPSNKHDLMIITYDQEPYVSRIRILEGASGDQVTEITNGVSTIWTATDDVTGDGLPEIIAAMPDGSSRWRIQGMTFSGVVRWSKIENDNLWTIFPVNRGQGVDAILTYADDFSSFPSHQLTTLYGALDGNGWRQADNVTAFDIIGDVDGDGFSEFSSDYVQQTWTSDSYTIFLDISVISGATGQFVWPRKRINVATDDPCYEFWPWGYSYPDVSGDGIRDFVYYVERTARRDDSSLGIQTTVISGSDGTQILQAPEHPTWDETPKPCGASVSKCDLDADGDTDFMRIVNPGKDMSIVIESGRDLAFLWELDPNLDFIPEPFPRRLGGNIAAGTEDEFILTLIDSESGFYSNLAFSRESQIWAY